MIKSNNPHLAGGEHWGTIEEVHNIHIYKKTNPLTYYLGWFIPPIGLSLVLEVEQMMWGE